MSLSRYDTWVRSPLGFAIPGANIYLCTQPASVSSVPPSPATPIFADAAGTLLLPGNTLQTDGLGHAGFYVAPGVYTLVIVLSGKVTNYYPDQLVNALTSIVLPSTGNGSFIVSAAANMQTAPNGDIVTTDGSGNARDSGTQLSTLATTASPTFTGIVTAPILVAPVQVGGSLITLYGATDAYSGLIQSAINALPSAGGTVDARALGVASVAQGTVDPGTKTVKILLGAAGYTFTQIVLECGMQIEGTGDGGTGESPIASTQINQASATTDLFVLGTAAASKDVYGTRLSGFRCAGAGGAASNCFNLAGSTNSGGLIYADWSDITIVGGFTGTGLLINGAGSFQQLSRFSNIKAYRSPASSTAVCLALSGYCGQLGFYDCVFSAIPESNSPGTGLGTNITIATAAGTGPFAGSTLTPYSINFVNCTIQQANVGVSINQGAGVVFQGCHFEDINTCFNIAGDSYTQGGDVWTNTVLINGNCFIGYCGVNTGSGTIVTAAGTGTQVVFTNNHVAQTTVDCLVNCTSPANVAVANNNVPNVTTLLTGSGTEQFTIDGNVSVVGESLYLGNSANNIILQYNSTNAVANVPGNFLTIVRNGVAYLLNLDTSGNLGIAGALSLAGATPTTTTGQIGLGTTVGIGNGSPGTISAPAKSTGSGPATPGTVVGWLEIDVAGSKKWIPYCT